MMISVNLRPGLKRKGGGNRLQGAGERVKALASQGQGSAARRRGRLVAGRRRLAGRASGRSRAPSSTDWSRGWSRPRPRTAGSRRSSSRRRSRSSIRDSLLAQIGVIRDVDRRPLCVAARARRGGAGAAGLHLAHRAGGPGPRGAAGRPTRPPADSVRQLPPAFRIQGRTVDIQAYTRFLRQLEASPWVIDVMPVSVSTVVEQERPVTAFTIRANFKPADSAYIRTVPLSQSVR